MAGFPSIVYAMSFGRVRRAASPAIERSGNLADKHIDVPKNFSQFVRKLRRSLGLTQEQFAVKVGVTFSTVNRWENGRGTPSPLAMRRITAIRSATKAR